MPTSTSFHLSPQPYLFFLSIILYLSSMYSFLNKTYMIIEWNILTINSTPINLPLILDQWSLLFSSLVLFISFNVMKFSEIYMKDDPLMNKFSLVMILFVSSMLMLIFIPNMITLLIGWDGLGLTSFFLVVYYQNKKSLSAGMLTVLTNRVGDILIIISIAWLLSSGQWTTLLHPLSYNTSALIMVGMIAAMTKSAQIPFSSWLPAAMAAPTPVSALVHSSTLVTAGVYLLFRFYPFFKSFYFNTSILFIGALTMTLAGLIALMETDMKKMIALSTLSQLGVMMMTLGMNLPTLTFFHLSTHALFKSLLFICAGMLINYNNHNQDLRLLSSTSYTLPHISTSMLVANMSLCALPFLSGFYSKDQIIENYLFSNMTLLSSTLILMGTSLTTLYSMRLTLSLISLSPQPCPTSPLTPHYKILTPLTLLSSSAIMAGSELNWLFHMTTPLTMPLSLKMMPIITVVMSIMISISMWMSNFQSTKLSKTFSLASFLLSSMLLMTPMSTHLISKIPMQPALNSASLVDQGLTSILGPQGLYLTLTNMASFTSNFQSNSINKQLVMMFLLILPLMLLYY